MPQNELSNDQTRAATTSGKVFNTSHTTVVNA